VHYFSSITYTTVGYGDLVLPMEWRNLSGIEALTGIRWEAFPRASSSSS
jgi:hypothetical protein